MSNWKKVIYKQIQPIHIGYGNYGVINETRIFIPGITMWGALTNAFGKEKNWTNEDYQKEENKKLFENITCFYPMIDSAVLYPRFENGEFYFCEYDLNNKKFVDKGYKISEKEFRYEYIDTYVSTAINPTTLNAKDESLHEIDIILPQGKEDKKQLYWVGYVNSSKKIPREIYVGGDSRYGFGLMEFVEEKEENYPYKVIKGIYQEEDNKNKEDNKKENPIPKNEPILNFLPFKNDLKFEGKLEILAEFDFNENTPHVNNASYYIIPGSIIK